MPGIPRYFSSCEPPAAPTKPVPAPGPPIPAPALPTVGACSKAVPNVSLLYKFPLPDLTLAATGVDSADACASLCQKEDCCSGYTWHDSTLGTYALRCYFVTNPMAVWSRAQKASPGHVSGLCNHGKDADKPCPGTVNPTPCRAATVTCASNNVEQVSRTPPPTHMRLDFFMYYLPRLV